jgi:hypothetical protein
MKLQYGRVVVGAGALMGCVAIGTVFSLAVFLQPMSDATGWSRTGISSAMTIVFLTSATGCRDGNGGKASGLAQVKGTLTGIKARDGQLQYFPEAGVTPTSRKGRPCSTTRNGQSQS